MSAKTSIRTRGEAAERSIILPRQGWGALERAGKGSVASDRRSEPLPLAAPIPPPRAQSGAGLACEGSGGRARWGCSRGRCEACGRHGASGRATACGRREQGPAAHLHSDDARDGDEKQRLNLECAISNVSERKQRARAGALIASSGVKRGRTPRDDTQCPMSLAFPLYRCQCEGGLSVRV